MGFDRYDGQKLILIVDDDPTIGLLMGESLETAGYRVEVAEDGEHALAFLADCIPDLIMLDVMMPGIDGFQVCERVRKIPNRANIPIVLMTGKNDLESINRAYKIGVTDFIAKPIDWGNLAFRINFILRATTAFSDLKKSEKRLSHAQRIAQIGSWEWQLESDKIWFSDEALRILRISPQRHENSYQTFVSRIDPKDRANVENAVFEAIEHSGYYSIDHELSLPDGTVCSVHTEAEVVRDPNGVPISLQGIIQDITERKKMEIELRQTKAAAEAANIAKSAFLANMSHEIRTPLNSVLGNAQLLEMTDLTNDQQEHVADLKISGQILLSLINDILDLSKIEAGAIEIEHAEFSLHDCIKDSLKMHKLAALRKGLNLKADVDAAIPHHLLGDQLRIKQILLNLLGNAIKFTSKGHITISARLQENNDTSVLVKIVVQDTGIGINASALEKIFTDFVQEDSSTTRRYGGTGLGLSICKRLIKLMGGSISVESSLDIGSSFTVIIPFQVCPHATIIGNVQPNVAASWDGIPLRVLFVEDDVGNHKLGVSLLSRLGHFCTVAENGRECLESLEHGSFDIVLMDIQMPVMNGEEALLEIRRREKDTKNRQRVIALTAYSLRGETERLMKLGFNGHVSKPINFKELISTMKQAMELT